MGIKEIAKKAEVSPATVSRVLNGTKAVSPELKERVLSIIKYEGYEANHIARSMVLKKNFTVGLIIPNISEMYHRIIFSSIEETLEEAGYKVIVYRVKDEPNHEQVYWDLLMKNRADGIIIMHETSKPEIYSQIKNTSVPVVLCSINIPSMDIPKVRIDDYRAALDGTRYLLELGHRHIGIILGRGYSAGDQRLQGYRDALEKHSIAFNSELVEVGEYTMESGSRAVTRLFSRNNAITAIYSMCDEMAIGVLHGLRQMGLSVPEDVSVLGLDGIDILPYLCPPLSSVQQPIPEIGRQSAKILLAMMNGEQVDTSPVVLEHKLVERQSCRSLLTH